MGHIANLKWNIITEDGEEKMTISEYNKREDLHKLIGLQAATPRDRRVVFMGTTIVSYPSDMIEWDDKKRAIINEIENEVSKNPLKYFVPQDDEVLKFLNDGAIPESLKLFTAPNGVGKAQPKDTIIPTPTGNRRFGDLKVGDYVFGGDGIPCRVTAIHDRGIRPINKVELDGGMASTMCCDDHLWVYLRHSRAYKAKESRKKKNSTLNKWEVLPTSEIIKIQGRDGGPQRTGYIPSCKPTYRPERAFIIQPYTMGVLLGDGSMRSCSIASSDKEIIEYVAKELPLGSKISKNKSKYAYSISGTASKLNAGKGGRIVPHRENPVRMELSRYGLLNKGSYTKFIPDEYMNSSAYQRIELLKGLMDTDGHSSNTISEFTTCSDRLAEQVIELVHSIGGKANRAKRVTKDQNGTKCISNRLNIWLPFCPFKLIRKQMLWKKTSFRLDRRVTRILSAGTADCMCISVNSPDHTYLTNDYIVTHNSVTGWIDVLLDIIPCDKSWPIFSEHGVTPRRYVGPYTKGGVAIVTYEWENHITTIWPQIVRRWTPAQFLGEYAEGGKAVINWKSSPRIYIADTPVYFRACSQAQTVFEAAAMDVIWWDEQGEEAKFDGANARVRRRHGRHTMTLTPHRVEGRPDTGAGSFIHKLYKGEQTSGLEIRRYHCGIENIPATIYSEEGKRAAFKEWEEEPTNSGDVKKLREGRSRLYGEFHETSGLVFDDFNPQVSIIEPVKIKKSWTKYRAIDHGRIEPCAAIMAAVTSDGDVIVFDEYYEKDRTIDENCSGIISSCGNERTKLESFKDYRGRVYDRFEEVPKSNQFRWTKIDPRSAGKNLDDGGITIGRMYELGGIRVQPGSGQTPNMMVPVVREYMKQDPDRKHIVTGEPGAPRLYITSTCKNLIKEIQGYVYEAVQRKDRRGKTSWQERPKQENDHAIMCLMLMCMENLVWIPTDEEEEAIDTEHDMNKDTNFVADPYAGY